MSYVGNPLVNAFSSREKQDLTGQSGTSFTLTHAVSHANDLSVYINHVRQEPTTAYSVNGTTLTTTGSVAATDDFYIIYDELAVQSISHPTDQALTATSGTFTSGLVGTTGTFSGAVSGTNGTFSGNVSGTLTTAAQPNITSVGTLTGLTVGNNVTFSAANPQLFLNATADGGEGSVNFKDDEGNIDGKIAYRTDYAGQTDNFMTFNTNGSNERMRITDSGNVGIGVIPSDRLHVKGFAQVESNAGDGNYIRFNNTANTNGKIWRIGDGVLSHGTFSIYSQTDNTFPFNVSLDGVVGSTVTNGVARYRNHTSFSLGYGSNIHLTVGQGLVNVSNRSYGYGALFMVSYASQVAEVSDPSNQFDIGSGGNNLGAGVYKNNNDYTIHVINKDSNGATRGYSVQVLSNNY